jgi:DNA replicative helicase MCM subunit Mcm2 (Cdc46/Mcm family)
LCDHHPESIVITFNFFTNTIGICYPQRLACKGAMMGVTIPSKCEGGSEKEDCPFIIIADNCEYIDQQTLKLQECPEVVPTGEMPRNIMLSGEA